MKLVHRSIEKDGTVSLVPEEAEDMWHVYNLITEGDSVRSTTIRKVQNESSTGSSTSSRIRTTLTIAVEDIDFDSQSCQLRLKGRNIVENQYVKKNAYHTLDLEPNRLFSLRKAEWDSVSLDRLEISCNPIHSADLATIIMQEGLAHICLIKSSMTIVRSKIESSIPRKRKGHTQQHEKGLARFFDNIIQGMLRHINFDVVKCILIASPGFVRDQFYEYMQQNAIKNDNKILIDNKDKFKLVHSSSGFKYSLKEVLQDPTVLSKISDTMAVREIKLLQTFFTTLNCEPSKAFYGKKHIETANEAQAIETLLISDKLFKSKDFNLRKQYVRIVDSVREYGGDVKVFSSMHITGEQLDQITGIAAILRFPMPELEEDSQSSENEDD